MTALLLGASKYTGLANSLLSRCPSIQSSFVQSYLSFADCRGKFFFFVDFFGIADIERKCLLDT